MFTLRKKKLSGNDLTDLAINIKFLFSSYVRLSVHTTEQKNLKYLDLLIHSKFKGRPLQNTISFPEGFKNDSFKVQRF